MTVTVNEDVSTERMVAFLRHASTIDEELAFFNLIADRLEELEGELDALTNDMSVNTGDE